MTCDTYPREISEQRGRYDDQPAVEGPDARSEEFFRSGPTRSRRGDEFIARGFSVHETCRRQGLDMWGYLQRAVVAWIDKVPHPSLLPAAVPTG